MPNDANAPRPNQFLDGFQYYPDDGTLALNEVRYLCSRPTMLVALQKSLESELPYDVQNMIVNAAVADSAGIATRLRETFSFSPDQVISTFARLMSESGWGAMRVEMLQEEMGEVVVRVDGSAFAGEYGPSTTSICLYTLGMLHGAILAAFNEQVEGQEVQCVAKGDSCCRFAFSVVRSL